MRPSPMWSRPGRPARSEQPFVVHEPATTRSLYPAALKLHVCAVIVSIYQGHPGLVTHDYLAAINDDIDRTIVDLCGVGLWSYCENGYLVPDHEVRRIALLVHEQANASP